MYYDLDDLKAVDENTNIKISLSGTETIALARDLFGSGKFYWSGYGEIEEYARLMHEGACEHRNARNAYRAQERAKAIEYLEAIGVSLTAEEVA